EIKVMPNPVSENQKLSIYIPGNSRSNRVRFMDISGKVITEKVLNGGLNEINVGLPKGMYMLKIIGEETSYTTKLAVN
ncbi:MAG TPA: T9SS type A sorting domain-containing protein, partial [Draconibacterium sp.]|nr:T9SS type A sorting domain-containing protein [Draconibacterium sp.]